MEFVCIVMHVLIRVYRYLRYLRVHLWLHALCFVGSDINRLQTVETFVNNHGEENFFMMIRIRAGFGHSIF